MSTQRIKVGSKNKGNRTDFRTRMHRKKEHSPAPGFLPACCLFLFLLGTGIPYQELPHPVNFVSIKLPSDEQEWGDMNIKALKAKAAIALPVSSSGRKSRDTLWEINFQEYIFQEQDRLSFLANRYGLALDTLLSFNHISNIKKLKAGCMLRIPETDGILYKTAKRDNLPAILEKFQVDGKKMHQYNPGLRSFREGQRLPEGLEIFIPEAALGKKKLRECMKQVYLFPVRGRIITPYGLCEDPFTQIMTYHDGIDIQCLEGSPVYAARDGRILSAGYTSSYGNYVIIKHGQGYESLYAHLGEITRKGKGRVLQGDIIGIAGKSGYAPVVHLHFSLLKEKEELDPMDYLY